MANVMSISMGKKKSPAKGAAKKAVKAVGRMTGKKMKGKKAC